MLVSAGSVSRQADIAGGQFALDPPQRSLKSATRVVGAGSTGGPTLPGRDFAAPSSSTTNDSSTLPW